MTMNHTSRIVKLIGLALWIITSTTNTQAQESMNNNLFCGFDAVTCDDFSARINKEYRHGDFICSNNHQYHFGLSWDGDLCLCDALSQKKWCAEVGREEDDAYFIMQMNGDLTLRRKLEDKNSDELTWRTKTSSHYGSHLTITDDGIALIRNRSDYIIWSTGPLIGSFKQTEHFQLQDRNFNEFTIYITGDTPYSKRDKKQLPNQIASLPGDAEALFHLGDIMRSSGHVCARTSYSDIYDIFQESHKPVFVLPGDNDANDCPDFNRAWRNWKQTFLEPSRRTENNWDVSHFGDIIRQEDSANFAFVYKEMLLIGVDVVGGLPHNPEEWRNRHDLNLEWVTNHIETYFGVGKEAKAILLLGHGRPQRTNKDFFFPLSERLKDELQIDMNKILYVHGDGHKPESYVKFGLRCVQVDRGNDKWLKLTVNANNEDPFDSVHGVFSSI